MTQKYSDIEKNIRKYLTLCAGQASTNSVALTTDATYTKFNVNITSGVLQINSPTLPGAPTSLTAIVNTTYIGLTWVAPIDSGGLPILYYNIYRGVVSGSLTLYTTSTDTYYDDYDIVAGTYYYAVAAVTTVGEGVQSNESFGTWLGPSFVISGLAYTQNSDCQSSILEDKLIPAGLVCAVDTNNQVSITKDENISAGLVCVVDTDNQVSITEDENIPAGLVYTIGTDLT